jgi:hypothetical protein
MRRRRCAVGACAARRWRRLASSVWPEAALAGARTLADRLIASQLAQTGLPATYEIETIGGRTQVLRNIVIGDPRKPDLTVERMEVRMAYGLRGARIGGITLIRPGSMAGIMPTS